MSAILFVTVRDLKTHNMPAGVMVSKTRKGQVRVLPRVIGKRVIKEQFVPVDFVDLHMKGYIAVVGEIPANIKSMYPESKEA